MLWLTDILRKGFDPDSAPKFFSYWNQFTEWNSNEWEFDRALFAFHLYANLVLLYRVLMAGEESEYMPRSWVLKRGAESRERATALRDWLITHSEGHLGSDGLPFISFISSITPHSPYKKSKN